MDYKSSYEEINSRLDNISRRTKAITPDATKEEIFSLTHDVDWMVSLIKDLIKSDVA